MRYQGKITDWKDEQGFGFVTPNGGGDRAFVHIRAFVSRSRRPANGMLITYEPVLDTNRRLRADNIKFASGGEQRPISSYAAAAKPQPLALVFGILFCVSLWLAAWAGSLPFIVPSIYLAASIIAFLAYAIDKSAAQNNQWRTQESTLHLLGLVGGWPGALLAQQTLRHKSKKKEFQTVFWATVFINCTALGAGLLKLSV